MAGRTHVDSSVGERRLRPIYDWLDYGNNKKALQEADKVLKKQPNFLCAKVLKGLALLRLGKEEECDQLLETVRAEVPADDSTLQAMTICYRETHKPERICEVYEAASKKDPTNEELLTHLFMSYVRVCDYKRQQQTALALYKIKPKNPYYFWAVMSVVMQAYRADEKISRAITLPLAERMVKKLVGEGKIEAEQEVQLYVMILEMQGKYEEALEVIAGPLGEKLVSYVCVPLKQAHLLMKLEKWREANHIFKTMIGTNKGVDQWSYYMDYFESAYKQSPCDDADTSTQADSSQETYADHTSAMCKAYLDRLSALNVAPKPYRAPFLAVMELYRRMKDRGENPEELLGDIVDMLMRYVRVFGDKPCCVSDLKTFLPLVPEDRRSEFVGHVTQFVCLERDEFPAQQVQMQRHVSSVQLARCLGLQDRLGSKDKLDQAAHLMAHYEHGFRFNAEVSHPTEFGCNDAYAVLVCHSLYDVWCATGMSEHLLEAIHVLEYALTFSPSNFHCKLLLLRFYQLLGAASAAHKVYELLDVKHMQLDSLGYYHCSHIVAMGHVTLAHTLYDHTLKFFTSNYKDSIDHLTFSYKYGSFLKIEEFVEFRERLNNSLHYSLLAVDKMLLELLTCDTHAGAALLLDAMGLSPGTDNVDWTNLQDNRDLSIVTTWEPQARQVNDALKRRTFEEDLEYLRLRNLIVRSLAASLDLGKQCHQHAGNAIANGDAGETSKLDVLNKLVGELRQEFERVASTLKEPVSNAILGAPLPSRLHSFPCPTTSRILVDMLCLVESLARDDDSLLTRVGQTTSDFVSVDVARTSAAMRGLKVEPGSDRFRGKKELLERVVNVVELISLVALLCGVCNSLMKPHKVPLVKRGRKKKDIVNKPMLVHRVDVFNKLVTDLKSAATELDSGLRHWESLTPQANLPALLGSLSLTPGDAVPPFKQARTNIAALVQDKINDSYLGSLRELRQIVQSKIKYLTDVRV